MALRGATIGLVPLICALLGTVPVFAENVPLPVPAPHAKAGAAPPGAAPPASNDGSATAQAPKGFFPFTLPFGKGGAPQQATVFDAKQKALLDRISLYLSSVQTLVGEFVQVGPDGGRTKGTFYMQKPGKIRFEYDPPTPIDLIADGSFVAVLNHDLATQQLFKLSQTPLRYLLADRIDLMHDTNIVSVSTDDKFATVVIEEQEVLIGTNRLMIMFDAKDLTLKQWTVTDPQGYDTTVAVYNLDTTKKPDPNLFVINYNTGVSNQ